MTTGTTTLKIDNATLAALRSFLASATEASEAGIVREDLGNGAARLHAPESFAIDAAAIAAANRAYAAETTSHHGPGVHHLVRDLARAVDSAVADTAKQEAAVRERLDEIEIPSAGGWAPAIHVRTEPRICVEVSAHGSGGIDGLVGQVTDEAKKAMRYFKPTGYIRTSRKIEVRGSIWCG